MKTRPKTNNFLSFDGKSFFKKILYFSPYWDYKSNQILLSEKIININPMENSI